MEISQILENELHVTFKPSIPTDNLPIDTPFEYFSLLIHAYLLQHGFLCTGLLNLDHPAPEPIIDLKPYSGQWKAKGIDLILFKYDNQAVVKFEKQADKLRVEISVDQKSKNVTLAIPSEFEDVNSLIFHYQEDLDSLINEVFGPKLLQEKE